MENEWSALDICNMKEAFKEVQLGLSFLRRSDMTLQAPNGQGDEQSCMQASNALERQEVPIG